MTPKRSAAPPRLWVTAAAVILLPVGARASDAPINSPPAPGPVQDVERNVTPDAASLYMEEVIRLDATQLRPITIAPDGTLHKGCVMTNAGLESATPALTASENVKMDMARAAVEASRAAGTLLVTELPEDTESATPEELAAMKMQQLEALRSVPPAADPIAGIGEDLPAVQEVGPSGLSAGEQAKLRGETPMAPPSSETSEPVSPERTPVGDGAPSSSNANPNTSTNATTEKENRDA